MRSWEHALVLTAGAAIAGCGFQLASAPGDAQPPPDAPPPVVCSANECRLRIDSDVDFAGATSLIDVAIEPDVATPPDAVRATLTPAAYVRGAVILRGTNMGHGGFGAGVNWSAIDGATVAGVSFGLTDLAMTTTAPLGVGITANNNWTYWIEGELELPAGGNDFDLYADDVASLQIAPPNTRAFATVVAAEFPTSQGGTFDAGAGGWFPFRAAVVQTTGGSAAMRIRTASPTGGALASIPRARLRGRVDGLRGAFLVAWDDRLFGGPATASLYTGALLDDTIDQPLAPGLTSADDLAQRWFGQLRVTTPGDYRLRTISDDGNRVLLADQASADRVGEVAGNITTTAAATLRTGWNDLVIDYSQVGGVEEINMTLDSAPTGVVEGGLLPVAQLRPVMPRRSAVISSFDPAQIGIPNNTATGIDRTFTPDPLGSEVVREVRVSYQLQHNMLGELDMTLTHNGKTEVLRNNTTNGNRWHAPTMFTGDPLAGSWTLHVDDQNGGTTGSLSSWTLTVFTQGGPGQIAERSEWISTVRDLELDGQVSSIQAIDAGLALPPGSTVELYARTCSTVAMCDEEPWSGPHAPLTALSITPARYAQLRVVMTSNGVDEPAVDFVELSYQVIPR